MTLLLIIVLRELYFALEYSNEDATYVSCVLRRVSVWLVLGPGYIHSCEDMGRQAVKWNTPASLSYIEW